ncbi:alanine/glycine:cation symporter family protein [candidate division KSB1 bacterium]
MMFQDILDGILNFAGGIDAVLWGPWTMLFIAFVYLYFSVKTRFFQVRKLGYIVNRTIGKVFDRDRGEDKHTITPFQATTTALASTVGMGSIAGVATALSVGGPGAIFWMWLLALLGMITKTVEITLAVHYREIDGEGNHRGGPMYYINKGLGWRPLSVIFSLSMFINAVFVASLLQSHTVGRAFLSSYHMNPYITTGSMAIIAAVVVIGGIKRIGYFCERLVPLMSAVYVLGGVIIFVYNFSQIPQVFGDIARYAFAPAPAAGGFAGALVIKAIQTGMARGMLVNEAGLGTAPMVHATANTKHPFQQGLWGAFEVFIVTFLICTISAFAILSTGVLPNGESGIDLVISAFTTVYPESAARMLISFSILTFCLTTQIGFFVYYETSVVYVFGKRAMYFLKWFYFIPAIVFAGISNVDKLWVFANIAVGICALPNLIAILALSGAFFRLMRDSLQEKNEFATEFIDVSKQYVQISNKSSV